MADGLREALSKYVPASVLDQAVEDLKSTEIAPEWYRNDIATVGAKAKRADELEAQLNSINKAPKREALASRFGVDLSSLKKAERHALEQFDWEGDEPSEEEFAQYLSEWEIPTTGQPQKDEQQVPAAARIVDHAVSSGQGQPPTQNADDFHRELEAAPDMNAAKEVLAKYGRLAPQEA